MYSNDLEACGMKCCYFLFHSEVNFLCVHCSGERQWPFGPLVFYEIEDFRGTMWSSLVLLFRIRAKMKSNGHNIYR